MMVAWSEGVAMTPSRCRSGIRGVRFRAGLCALLLVACWGCHPKKKEPNYGDNLAQAYRRGKIHQARGEFDVLANAITSYMSGEGHPPEVTDIDALAQIVEPQFVRVAPRKDPWGTPYSYTSDGTDWTLKCAGHDLQFGTEDDLVMTDGQVVKEPAGYSQVHD
jgi:hypothetical protein